MAFEVKRKAELSLVAFFADVLPDLSFYPSKGGTDDGGITLPKPPFGAIWIQNAENTITEGKTYLLSGTIVWVSRAEGRGQDVSDHTDAVKQICNAIQQLEPMTDLDRSLIICGMDISTVNEFTDSDRHAYGDTISFTMGVNELD